MKNISIIFLTLILFSCQGEKTTEAVENQKSITKNTVQLSDEQAKNATIQLEELGNKEISTVVHLKGKMSASPENQIHCGSKRCRLHWRLRLFANPLKYFRWVPNRD